MIERRTVWTMSVACAVSVANLYYCQPLLSNIARSLGVSDHAVSYLPMWTQAGTAVGMFAFVPLGDMLPRRRLIVLMSLAIACAALTMAVAPNLTLVSVAGFATGLTTIVPHLVLPFAAKLSPDEQRGHVVGTILGGLLTGILLARVVSGYVGDLFGWRAMYWIAAASMAALAAALRYALPVDLPDGRLRYSELLRSTARLVRTEPVLRDAAITGGMLFGSFSSFWATLVFFIGTPPYHYGARTAGLFGLVGAAGALIAPRAGKLADRRGPAFALSVAILTTIVSWAAFYGLGYRMWGLILGVILLDLGVQAGHVANQTRIYALIPEARSRLNMVYMVGYFLGGALGSALGAFGWSHWGWAGVCGAGLAQGVIGMGARLWNERPGLSGAAESSASI
ncbi:MAG TPA: MFS transporter [Bryobacteraceae bacterium]|nr:MFS transporter [Bryobacteraceae bacterium]